MKNKIILYFLLILTFTSFTLPLIKAEEKVYKIIRLVNDQVITNFDLEQRIRMAVLLNNVEVSNENLDIIANEILSMMVDEKLQSEKILEYNIIVNNDDIIDYIERLYSVNNINMDDISKILKENNIDINILTEFVRVNLGWNRLAGRLYYRTSKVSKTETDKLMNLRKDLSKTEAESLLRQEQIGLKAKRLLRDIKNEANIENR